MALFNGRSFIYFCNCGEKIKISSRALKDNRFGYTSENVLACFTRCNFMKRDYDYQLFVNHIRKISKNLLGVKNDSSS